MKLLYNRALITLAVLVTNSSVWSLLNNGLVKNVVKVADPLLDIDLENVLSTFKKSMNSLVFEKIGSDFPSNANDLLRHSFGITNEDRYLDGFQLLNKYGFTYEVYIVETSDGYFLKVVRIPGKGAVVLLVHGILFGWEDFITSGPDFGLAYLLARAGFDVWLLNCRGNTFSRKHTTLSPEEEEFWNFSWHEIGTKDLPATVDKILSITGEDQLIYIGHSQGTTSAFVWLSENPEYNRVVKLLICLSPVGYFNHVKSPVFRAVVPLRNEEYAIFNTLGRGQFLPRKNFSKILQELLCSTSVTSSFICSHVIFLLFGFDYAQLNFTNYPVQLAHQPSGASVKQVIHYLQEVASGYFRQFDYGKDINLEIYQSEEPPSYDLSNIIAPVALYYSKNDWLADPIDVRRLSEEIPNVVEMYMVPFDKFNHVDYLWAKDVIPLLYNRVFKLLKEYS